MRIFSIGVVFLISSFSLNCRAIAGSCDRLLTHYDNLQINRDVLTNSNTCFISIHPMRVKDLVYRDFLVTSEGLLMVFNSFGEGENSESTGAREFYFFPRGTGELQIVPDLKNEEVHVKIGANIEFTFSTKSADITSVSGGKITVDPTISPDKNGGVEITQYSGLFLDVGFALGQSPSQYKSRKSVFTDGIGNTCSLENQKIFSYANNDIQFARTDQELKKFLNSACPTLKTDF